MNTPDYAAGYLDGWLDSYLQLTRLNSGRSIAPGYVLGYHDGHRGYLAGKPMPKGGN
jgi:hypothetical protein